MVQSPHGVKNVTTSGIISGSKSQHIPKECSLVPVTGWWLQADDASFNLIFQEWRVWISVLSHLSRPRGIRSDYCESCRWKQLLLNRVISTCLPAVIISGFFYCWWLKKSPGVAVMKARQFPQNMEKKKFIYFITEFRLPRGTATVVSPYKSLVWELQPPVHAASACVSPTVCCKI